MVHVRSLSESNTIAYYSFLYISFELFWFGSLDIIIHVLCSLRRRIFEKCVRVQIRVAVKMVDSIGEWFNFLVLW